MQRAQHYQLAEHIALSVTHELTKLKDELPQELDVAELRTYKARLHGISVAIELGKLHAALANCRVKEVDLAESQDHRPTAAPSDQDQLQRPTEDPQPNHNDQ